MGLDKDDNYMGPLPCAEPRACHYCNYISTSVYMGYDGNLQCGSIDCCKPHVKKKGI